MDGCMYVCVYIYANPPKKKEKNYREVPRERTNALMFKLLVYDPGLWLGFEVHMYIGRSLHSALTDSYS